MRIMLILLSLWAWNAANAEMTLLKPTATAPDGRARVALVVGIAGYPELSSTNAFETLTHPLNDATDIATELQRYGFYVILLKDATKKEFEDAVNCFAKECEEDWKIRENSVALFYYSGHGLVVLDKGKKTNFVMPKRGFKDAADVKEHGFSTNWLLNKMNAAQIKLMFLDACRSEKSLLEKKGFSDEDAGFVRMDLDGFEEKGTKSAHGIVIGYASQEGKPAIGHKKQRNSFYTAGLLEMLQNQAHQPIDRLLKLTSDRVFNLSMNKQMPWDDRRLIGDFCFGNCRGETVFIPPQQSIKPEKVIQPEPVKPVEIPVKTYTLQVRADVSGAEIIVYNQILGKTPLDVELKEGSHEIIVKNNGRQAKQTINLQANRDFKVEFGKAVSPASSISPTRPPVLPTLSLADPKITTAPPEYQQAFDLLKRGHYDKAILGFESFIKQSPTGDYADNAQYWLGEAYYLKRDFVGAVTEFKKLVNYYPDSPKKSYALLKIGFCLDEFGDNSGARQTLEQVRKDFPNTNPARLAEERLKKLRQ